MNVEEEVASVLAAALHNLDVSRLAPHQTIAAAVAASLLRSTGGALLADAAGVGKTYVAVALARLFEAEGYRVAIFVPASLVTQWRRVCVQAGVIADPLSHDSLLGDRASISADLVIVDEAHRFRNRSSRRHQQLAALVTGRMALLMTATPVWNSNDDLSAILGFIMPDYPLQQSGVTALPFDRSSQVIRRGGDVLPRELQFEKAHFRFVRYELEVDAETVRLVDSLLFPGVAGSNRHLLRNLLWRRLESSEAAFRETVRHLRSFVCRLKEANSQGLDLTRREFRRLFDCDATFVQELLFPEAFFQPSAEPIEEATVDREIDTLNALARKSVAEPKRELLRSLLRELYDRAVLFTSSIATARGLHRELSRTVRCALLTSSDAEFQNRRIGARELIDLQQKGEVDLLITTDVGGEGLDLQAASRVIHYDLPWNPARIEQRNGRISRIGQQRVPESWCFLPRMARSGIGRILREKSRLISIPDSHVPQLSFARNSGPPMLIGKSAGAVAGIIGVSHGGGLIDELLFIDGSEITMNGATLTRVLSALEVAREWTSGRGADLSRFVNAHLTTRRSELALVPRMQACESIDRFLSSLSTRSEVDLATSCIRASAAEVFTRSGRDAVAALEREVRLVRGCCDRPHEIVAAVVALECERSPGALEDGGAALHIDGRGIRKEGCIGCR